MPVQVTEAGRGADVPHGDAGVGAGGWQEAAVGAEYHAAQVVMPGGQDGGRVAGQVPQGDVAVRASGGEGATIGTEDGTEDGVGGVAVPGTGIDLLAVGRVPDLDGGVL